MNRPRSRKPTPAYTRSAISVDRRLAVVQPRASASWRWRAASAVSNPRRRAIASVDMLNAAVAIVVEGNRRGDVLAVEVSTEDVKRGGISAAEEPLGQDEGACARAANRSMAAPAYAASIVVKVGVDDVGHSQPGS